MPSSDVAVRPRASAGLVFLREEPEGLSVLLGRRSASARFMPSVYVVPGGGLAAVDRAASGFREDLPRPVGALDTATVRDLLPFARAALRESFEETGALLGEEDESVSCDAPAKVAHWQAYRRRRLQPAFGRLQLIARAITPVGSPIRYHTRFFMADGTGLQRVGSGDGELEDIGWLQVDEALRRPMPEITVLVIGEALKRWRKTAGEHRAPLFYCRGDRLLRRGAGAE